MPIVRKNKKAELMEAAARLVATGGPEAATVRAIAREAGVTDAAVYRHYRSKDDLCRRAYAQILDELVLSKESLLARPGSLKERLHEWVRLTYEYFDRHAEAFTYVFLTSHVVPGNERGDAGRQGKLFMGDGQWRYGQRRDASHDGGDRLQPFFGTFAECAANDPRRCARRTGCRVRG